MQLICPLQGQIDISLVNTVMVHLYIISCDIGIRFPHFIGIHSYFIELACSGSQELNHYTTVAP